ncbi:MAG: biopolymer transporter ExbB [Paracoccaceae bacterium]
MDQPDREIEPIFTQPFRQIGLMVICLSLVGFGVYIASPVIGPVFVSNKLFNGFICLVFLVGVIACFWQVIELMSSVSWIEGFTGGGAGHVMAKAPRLLAPLAALLRSRGAKMQIGSASADSILDSVATRIEETRDITRYIVSLLIFLGLLGTFWGLATTIPALVETIRSLEQQDGEGAAGVLARLVGGLDKQLSGMGVAFASSLLGLAGSLVVGLLELFASNGQNRFYRELEEWLSTITRLGFSSGDTDGSDTSNTAAMFAHSAEQMDALQSLFTQSDVNRSLVDDQLGMLVASVEGLVAKLDVKDTESPVLTRVAQGQERLIAILEKNAAETEEAGGAHVDAESRMRLRSIDVQLLRILEEMSSGRQESLADLRTDLAALTRSIKAAKPDPAIAGNRGG